jgi:GGDEF domain-containing protein
MTAQKPTDKAADPMSSALLRGLTAPPAPPAAPSALDQTIARQRLDPTDLPVFRERILDLHRRNLNVAEALNAGSLQVLGLETVKKRFGARWQTARDQVLRMVEQCIVRSITPDDVFVRMGEEQYVVLFCSSTRAEARATARRIAAAIDERLSGVIPGENQVSVRGVVVELDRPPLPESIASPEGLAQQVAKAETKAAADERAAFDEMASRLRLSFWPMANLKKRLISSYDAQVGREGEGSAAKLPSESGGVGELDCALDCYALREAGKWLARRPKLGHKATLMVPVRFDTLAVKVHRTAYLEACGTLPDQARGRLLLKIVDFPDTMLQARLQGVLAYVSPFVLGFVARVPLGYRGFDQLAGLRVLAIATEGKHLGRPTEKDTEELRKLANQAALRNVRVILLGVPSIEAGTVARRAGVDYVTGAAILPKLPAPGRVFPLT